MSGGDLRTLKAMGFRRVARFGTRAEIAKPGRMNVSGEAGDRIAYIVDELPEAQQLWSSSDPATYVWLVPGEDRPCYVGKASQGLAARANQWEGGFHGSSEQRARLTQNDATKVSAGLADAQRIRAAWREGKTIEVWGRKAGHISLLNIEGSLVSAEEEILIKLLAPRWNHGRTEDGVDPVTQTD